MQYSNKYIVGFATLVCVVCSIFVSGSAVILKDRQKSNQLLDLQKNVISVSGLATPEETSAMTPDEITAKFSSKQDAKENGLQSYIEITYIDLEKNGAEVKYESVEAYKKENKGQCQELSKENNRPQIRCLPKIQMIYNVYQDNKLDRVIFPVEGKGLWSTMKGFLALGKDKQTIEGLTFYSHGETPGLGGEIDNPDWKKQWVGKKAFDNATNIGGSIDVVKVKVLKGKVKSPQTADDCVNGDKKDGCYQVDGLSGATLTSNGVNYLVQFWLSDMGYGNYIKKMAN